MGEIAKREPDTVSDTNAIIQVIERAAANPSVDMDKMERLLQMQERILAKNAEAAFNVAMVRAQSRIRQVSADSENKQTHSRYASYSALDKALRPVYTDEGFSLSFDTGDGAPPEHVRVVCYVAHIDGHSRTYHVDMPADGKGAKGGDVMTKTHAAGSAMQYGMRYLVKLIFNVAIGDDDDGNGATQLERINAKQLADLIAKIEEVGAKKDQFLKFLKLNRLEDLPAVNYNAAIRALEDKAKGVR